MTIKEISFPFTLEEIGPLFLNGKIGHINIVAYGNNTLKWEFKEDDERSVIEDARYENPACKHDDPKQQRSDGAPRGAIEERKDNVQRGSGKVDLSSHRIGKKNKFGKG